MVDSWNENYNGNVTENKICCNKIIKYIHKLDCGS